MINRGYDIGPILERVKKRSIELGVRKLVFVSSSGRTAKECAQFFKSDDFDLIMVTDRANSYWSINLVPEPLRNSFKDEWPLEVTDIDFKCGIAPDSPQAQVLFQLGIKRIVQGTEIFRGILLPSGSNTNQVVAETLKLFGDGVKVAIECALMACDAGAVNPGEDIVSMAFPPMKPYAALVLRVAHSDELFGTTWQTRSIPDFRVREIIDKGWY